MIRIITKPDLSQLLRIWNQHYQILTTAKKKHTKKSLNAWYAKRGEIKHEVFGFFATNKLKAFMVVKYKENNTFWIKQLACDKKECEKGYGTSLVKFAIKEAKNMPIFSEVMVHNWEALNFFFKHNFRIVNYNEKLQEFVLQYQK